MIKTELHKCIYCGKEAFYQFKNGKWCCSPNMNGCPAIKEIRRQSAINQHNNLDFKAKDNQSKYPDKGEHICVYCGEYAEYKLKSGKWCCCENFQQCPANRVKFKNKVKRDYKQIYKNLPSETKERIAAPLRNPEVRKQAGTTLKARYASGEIVNHQKGKPHTQEEKDKIRTGIIRYFLTNNVPFFPRVSVKGCRYMDKLNEANNWNLQHGMNGGEISIGGFFLDGYDKELNIVFEYDEPFHYENVYENILKEKDIYRMNYIHEKLNCRFFRYNEKLDLFYEVKF